MDIFSWLHDKMYKTDGYDPVMASVVNPDGSTYEDDSLDPEALKKRKSTVPTTFGRVVKGLPGILQSGIAAAATPNIAYGGPTDVFRGMQAGQDYGQSRDLLNYNINRQRVLDASTLSQRPLEDAIRLATLENTKENTASLIAEREAQAKARADQEKLGELNRYLQLGQAGAQEMDEGTPASTEQITPGISLETNAQPPKPVPMSFKDPFSGKTLVVGKKGDMELDPDIGAELGVTPNAEGKYMVPETGLRELIKQKLKQPTPPKPEWDPETRAALIAVGAADPSNPTPQEMEKALQRKAQLHVGEHPTPAPREVPEGIQDKRNLNSAMNRVFTENGRDWNKVTQSLDKYIGDPEVGPYVQQIADHAQKQIAQGASVAKANSQIELLQNRALNASATGGRILQKIDALKKNYPTLFGTVRGGGISGSLISGHPAISAMTLPQDFINTTRQLQTDIKMFFQQQPPLEGYRSTTAAGNLQSAAGADGSGVFINPDGVASAIREMMDVNKQFANGIRSGKFPEGILPPAELAGAIGTPSATPTPATPAQARPQAPPPGTVAVTRKDGTAGFIPAAKAKDAAYMTKYGYTLVQ